MTRKEIKTEVKNILQSEQFYRQKSDFPGNDDYASFYLGSYLSLDPCGRYHHILSPNGATAKCMRYWENLESVCDELGVWTESGEGDGCDVYLCRAASETDIVE